MRAPSQSDFSVDVPDVGRFIFARKTIGDVFRIRSRYNSLTEGFYNENGSVADFGALALVTLTTLCVSAPEGHAPAELDPLMSDDWEERVIKIYGALRTKEGSFRRQPAQGSEGSGQVDGGDVRVLVPAEVQPAAEQSALPLDHA
jgi:hypothetical protein